MRIAFPIEIEAGEDAVRARFPDLPRVAAVEHVHVTQVLIAAREALANELGVFVQERQDIPRPSPARRRALVAPPLLVAAKVALYQTMRDQNVSNVALAGRLGTVEGTVRRLVSLHHRSHIDAIEQALTVLGKRLVLDMWSK